MEVKSNRTLHETHNKALSAHAAKMLSRRLVAASAVRIERDTLLTEATKMTNAVS